MPHRPSCFIRSLWPFGILAGLLAAAPPVLWAQVTLTRAVPGGLRPGETTEAQFTGSGLDGALRIWTSFPATVEIVEQKADRLKCKFTLAADAPLGVGGVVVASEKGASDTFWMVVDDLPSVAEAGNNHTLDGAQVLTLPAAVDGTADGVALDYFRFDLKTGQRISAEVYGARLASTCDAVLRLLDTSGRELAYVDDDGGWGADCRLTYTASQDGPVVLELRDNKFQSGPRYRLRIGDFPIVSTSLPLGARRHATTLLTFPCQPDEQVLPLPLQVSAASPASLVVGAKRSDGHVSSFVRVAVSDLPEFIEAPSSDETKAVERVSIPCAVNGILEKDEDRDTFEFAALKGQSLRFRTTTRMLGSPAYPYLRLYDAGQRLVAESPIGDGEEFSFQYAVPADGIYRLTVEELTRRGGPLHTYRVVIDEGPVVLQLKNVKDALYKIASPAADGCFLIDIQCQRNAYDGPVHLDWIDPVAELELFNRVIPAKAAEHRLYVAVRPETPAGTLVAGRLAGTATVATDSTAVPVETLSVVQAKTPGMTTPPLWHDGLFFLSTTAAAAPVIKIADEVRRLAVPAAGGEATLEIPFERANAEYKEGPALLTSELPGGVTAQAKAEGDKLNVSIKSAGQLPAGEHVLRLGIFATFKGRHQLIPLNIVLDVKN